ncbi:metal ABC transporter ATP-binding protein [Acetivibrio straminisolvens]|jgi:zinc transport system ATP-binding protein|uniref:Zinc ABC transporter ZnuC n=1 Tax=Acetivibrio straminisolvens JCM 21531 TaxID=1294263 RepID=W4VBZ6_9FIRM|nr:metal ABC transporter ATP-binding protein [Acetivibrio straminisolvens]GAE90727.1 zinc ABC transporter ZnuC [Acetivibrio straminisolvens JCM 21531]
MEKVIEISNLSFGYGERLILEDMSFSVEKGDFVGVIGPNGSGKSTLLKLLLRQIKPIKGEIKLLGQNIEKFNQWNKIGYVAQKASSFNTSFPATVEEVVSANLFPQIGLFKRIKSKHRELVYKALETVGMEDYKDRLIGNLSGGQQQRVFIARVLVSEPELIFLDEPTVGIDSESEGALYCLLGRLNQERGITIVMVSHDIGAVTVHANKIACMGNKGLVMNENTEEFAKNSLREIYGHDVNLHAHKHCCTNCWKKGAI